MTDLCITVPKQRRYSSITFWDWKPLLESKEDRLVHYKIPFFPREWCHRCYIIYKSKIIGYVLVDSFIEIKHSFNGKEQGKYLIFNTKTWTTIDPIQTRPCRGFSYLQGIEAVLNVYSSILEEAIKSTNKR